MRPTEEVTRAIQDLKTTLPAQWATLIEWLAAERDQIREDLERQRDDIAYRQQQGRAQILSEILEISETSLELLKKFNSRRP